MVRRGLAVAVTAAMSACGTGAQQGEDFATVDSELIFGTKIVELAQRDCRVVGVRPAASGTIRSAPQVSMLEVAPIGTTVQSMYFASTSYGPETRHGVIEFDVPAMGGHLTNATLRFTDAHGWLLDAVPSDLHQLTLYGDADGVVSTDDWTREGASALTFTTDLNDRRALEHSFNVTANVQLGGKLGVRVELDRAQSSGQYGSAFDAFSVDLTVCGESALPNGAPIGEPM